MTTPRRGETTKALTSGKSSSLFVDRGADPAAVMVDAVLVVPLRAMYPADPPSVTCWATKPSIARRGIAKMLLAAPFQRRFTLVELWSTFCATVGSVVPLPVDDENVVVVDALDDVAITL